MCLLKAIVIINILIILIVSKSVSLNSNKCIGGVIGDNGACICLPGYASFIYNTSRTTEISNICQPVCDIVKCGNNTNCVRPNECQCRIGFKYIDDRKYACEPMCRRTCKNGKCIDEKCICENNYKFIIEQNTCVPYCKNDHGNGICIDPHIYKCSKGGVDDICVDGVCNIYNECDCASPLLAMQIEYKEISGIFCASTNKNDEDVLCKEDYYILNVSRSVCVPLILKADNFRNITTSLDNDIKLGNCSLGCENGYCDNGECKCDTGYYSYFEEIDGGFTCESQCDTECQNGYCIGENECSCIPGYEKNNTIYECFPICEKTCINGKCIAPNMCKCNEGYAFTFDITICDFLDNSTDSTDEDNSNITETIAKKKLYIGIIITVIISILIISIFIIYIKLNSQTYFFKLGENNIVQQVPRDESFF